MDDDVVKGTIIDVCTKTFLIVSDEGQEKTVKCDTTEEFMSVLSVVTDKLPPERIEYADLAVN